MKIFDLLDRLRWIDGSPLRDRIEPYRRRVFEEKHCTDENGWPRYNLNLTGRAKKNSKTEDLVLDCFYCLLAPSPGGNQCYLLANDEGQANDDLNLAKKLIAANPALKQYLVVRKKMIERKDGHGFMMILPARDVAGAHGKTYRFAGFDEIHEYRTWDLLEAMQLDPTRPESQIFITSYASIYHKPGVPLFDLMQMGRTGTDPRMFFSWYAADFTTDPDFVEVEPEIRANPSLPSWPDGRNYLAQQQRRLPAHKYRRLHLNLPGLPEGSAYQPEPIMDSIDRGVTMRKREEGKKYDAFVDMSGGSSDDATLAIAHKDSEGRIVVDLVMNQGQPPPFDPRAAVARFAAVLKEWGLSTVQGDKFAGETFLKDFERHHIDYRVSKQSKSDMYEALEPVLNAREVLLPDVSTLEQQLLSLVWRGNKIDHASGEHDDWANAVAGVVTRLSRPSSPLTIIAGDYGGLTHDQADGIEEERNRVAAETVRSAINTRGSFFPGDF